MRCREDAEGCVGTYLPLCALERHTLSHGMRGRKRAALVAVGGDLIARKEAGVGKRQPREEEGTKTRIEKETPVASFPGA